jgi:hypothetical protein
LYETLFGEEIPCLSLAGQALVKELGDWYMTPTGVYIRIAASTKPPHWLPHFVPDSLLLQEVAYQTFINGVAASLHKHKKGVWPQFPLITPVGKIENFKQAMEEVNILSSYKFQEVPFIRHDPQEKSKEHLQQVGFQWSYSHENLLPGELISSRFCSSQGSRLQIKCLKLTKKQNKRMKSRCKWKTSSGKLNIVRIDDEESSSSSSMSLYNIESNEKHLEVSSRKTPTMIENKVLEQLDDVHSSLTMAKNLSKRHSQVPQGEEDPLSYNIDEVLEAFTFNLCKKEVSRKRIRNERQNDGTYKEV